MTAPLSDERLREIAAQLTSPQCDWLETHDMARELLSLRASAKVAEADRALVEHALQNGLNNSYARAELLAACRAARQSQPGDELTVKVNITHMGIPLDDEIQRKIAKYIASELRAAALRSAQEGKP